MFLKDLLLSKLLILVFFRRRVKRLKLRQRMENSLMKLLFLIMLLLYMMIMKIVMSKLFLVCNIIILKVNRIYNLFLYFFTEEVAIVEILIPATCTENCVTVKYTLNPILYNKRFSCNDRKKNCENDFI